LIAFRTRRTAAPGVERRGHELLFRPWGLRLPAGSRAAAVHGFESTTLTVRIGGRPERPVWPVSRSRVVPVRVGAAVGSAVVHYGSAAAPALLAGALGGVGGIATGSLVVQGLAAALLLFALSVVVHEVAHVTAFRVAFGPDVAAIMVARGPHLSLVRPRGRPARDAVVIVAGPLLTLPLALAAWAFAALGLFVPVLATCIAVGHVISLLLPAGDGAALGALVTEAVRRRRRRRRPPR
jgi:hypothetical protein